MGETFDPKLEPLRAFRDLVIAAEAAGMEGPELDRARAAFDMLRRRFGDERAADQVGYGPLPFEPMVIRELVTKRIER